MIFQRLSRILQRSALRVVILICLAPAVGLGVTSAASAAPLLVEGKTTVYQRVLTRPGADLQQTPGGAVIATLTPFEPFYVFARQDGWIEVGRAASGGAEGWITADSVVEWRQNIVAAFTNPANRSRQLIFADRDSLIAHMEHEAINEWHPQLLAETDAGAPRDGAGVISIEPPEHIDIAEQFYIMPILAFEQTFHPLSFDDTILVNVASLPLEDTPHATETGDFEVGVVFVVDTTQSMQTYFEVMRNQVQSLVSRMSGSEIGNKVNFGIVSFRDDISGVPDLEYRVREVLPLERRASQDVVLNALSEMREARANSPGFNEDSLAAVSYALEDIDWNADGNPFNGRFIILVTDAGPKLPGATGSGYDNTAEDLQAAAEALQTAIMVVHLKTPAGAAGNHDFATQQYRALSRFGDVDLYFPIEGGDAARLASETQRLVTFVRDRVAEAQGLSPELTDADAGDALTELGRAIRLQYLGAERGTSAPDVFDGWLSSVSQDDGRRPAVSLRLMLTRNELATMADLVEEFIRLGDALRSEDDIVAFHENIRATIVRMAQDPNRLIDPTAEGVGDAMEFLEDLPYKSVLLRTNLDRWIENAGERQVVIDGLNSKLRSYRRWLSSGDVWVPLYEGAPDSEWVTAMPVEFLP